MDGADYALIDASFNAQAGSLDELEEHLTTETRDNDWDELPGLLAAQEHGFAV